MELIQWVPPMGFFHRSILFGITIFQPQVPFSDSWPWSLTQVPRNGPSKYSPSHGSLQWVSSTGPSYLVSQFSNLRSLFQIPGLGPSHRSLAMVPPNILPPMGPKGPHRNTMVFLSCKKFTTHPCCPNPITWKQNGFSKIYMSDRIISSSLPLLYKDIVWWKYLHFCELNF